MSLVTKHHQLKTNWRHISLLQCSVSFSQPVPTAHHTHTHTHTSTDKTGAVERAPPSPNLTVLLKGEESV